MLTRRLALFALLSACTSTPTGTLEIVTGEEGDALTRAPAPTVLVVEALDAEGGARELSRAPLTSGADVSLGDAATSDVGAIRVTGLDAAGKAVVRGETLLFQFGALEQQDLEVFVQRTGELARVPRSPLTSLDAPIVDTLGGRYVVAASGTSTLLYDLLTLRALTAPALTRAARSMATFGTVILAIDDQGATSLDLSDSYASELPAPSGGTYAEVAGGATVLAPDGSSYVVGATRTEGGPSQRVLRIAADGKVTFAALQTPREGACAAWLEGRGLVVIGGDAAAPGAELLAAGSPQATPLPFPPDPSRACGASAIDPGRVVVAGGGIATARVLDLACTVDCKPVPWPGDVPVGRAQVVTLAADAVLVVGDDAVGTKAFRASATGTREIPLRVPRKNGRLVPLPNGASAIVGGAPAIESYRD